MPSVTRFVGNRFSAKCQLGNRLGNSPLSTTCRNIAGIHGLPSNGRGHQSRKLWRPAFNAQAELIGINGRCSFEKRGRINVGVGYAISINQVKLFFDHLSSGRIVDHATLGATVARDSSGQVRIDNILTSSDAFRRGLRYNDELISFAGRPVHSVNEFKNILGIFPKGWRVPLQYRRDGQIDSIHVRLAGLHSPEELFHIIQGESNADRRLPKSASLIP